ncbi:MAG: GntR family transcriptional regulator [Anaerolineae bacterium]
MSSQFRSKKTIIYEQLREEIVKGKYKPGERLVVDELATHMNASTIPIREAIQQLQADGFVTTQPHVGARIAEIDANFIYEVFALLESLEVICSRSACTLMTDDELDQLEEMITVMDVYIDKPTRWAEKNKEMHLFISECAKTTLVHKMIQQTFDHWERLRRHYLANISSSRIPDAQQEHKLLLGAMQNRDSDEVERIIRQHNQNALKSYIRHMQSEGHLLEQ